MAPNSMYLVSSCCDLDLSIATLIFCDLFRERESSSLFDIVERTREAASVINNEYCETMNFISMGPGGTIIMMGGPGDGGDLSCEPGEAFTDYVRGKLKPFPPCSPFQAGSSLERKTLWPGRRVAYQTSGGQQQTAKVVQWTEHTSGFMCPFTMWHLTLEEPK